MKLFNNKKGHVFLSKDLINESTSIKDFYQTYLNAKKKWIEDKLFEKGKTGGYILPETELIPYSFQKIKKAGSKDFERWLANKETMPIDLPNTLFDDKLKKELEKKLPTDCTFGKERYTKLLEKKLKEDTQLFYAYERIYKHKKEEKRVNVANMNSKEIKENFGKHTKQNEIDIRFIQNQDRILKLLCDSILSEKESKEEICLKNILPFSEHSPLNRSAVFEQSIKFKCGMIKVIAKDNEGQRREVEKYKELKTEEKEAYQDQKGYQWTVKRLWSIQTDGC